MNQFFFRATRKCRFPATCLWDYVCEKRKEDEDEAYRLSPVPWSPGIFGQERHEPIRLFPILR